MISRTTTSTAKQFFSNMLYFHDDLQSYAKPVAG